MISCQKYVAIKSMKNTAFDGVLKDLLEEAQTMQRLTHQYIVKMYGMSLPSKEEPLKLVSMWTEYNQTCQQTPLEPLTLSCNSHSASIHPSVQMVNNIQKFIAGETM